MLRWGLPLLPLLLTVLCMSAASAQRSHAPGALHVITVDQAITPATTRYVTKALETAAGQGAEALVIRLDTPGGLLDATRDIVKAILNAPLPVVVYIAPSGARGASAGTIISMASHVAAMAPATHIGAAHPVSIFGGEENQVMGEKILNDTAAYIEALATLRERNVDWAISAVRESKSITAQKALELKVIDLIATDMSDLARQLEGREVQMSGGRMRVLHTTGKPLVEQEMSVSQTFMTLISNPNLVFLLLILGLVGLYMEFSNPGMVFPGVLGAVCLVLALIAMQTLPVRYGALGLILLGVGLLVAEAFVPSFGILGISGLGSMLVGSLFLLDEGMTDLRVSRPMIFAAVAVVGGTALVVGRLLLRSQRIAPVSAQATMLGQTVIVRDEIGPGQEGLVAVHGELWRARSAHALAAGQPAVIEAVDGLVLTVAPPLAAGQPPAAQS